jgi:hypothetical protein
MSGNDFTPRGIGRGELRGANRHTHTSTLTETAQREFKIQWAEVEAGAGHGSCECRGTDVSGVKPYSFESCSTTSLRPRSSPNKRNTGVVATLCSTVRAMGLEGLLEAVDSPAGTGSRAAHRCGLVQFPIEVPENWPDTAGHGSAPARTPWRSR